MGYRVYWLYLDKSFNVQGTKCQDNQLVQDNQLDQTDQPQTKIPGSISTPSIQ